MTDEEIEQSLHIQRRALDEMVQQRRSGPEYRLLLDEVLRLERLLAETRKEPHAVEWSLEDGWPGVAHFNVAREVESMGTFVTVDEALRQAATYVKPVVP